MANFYHVNPETGNVNICRARPGKNRGCRFAENGVEPPHYATRGEAMAAAEKMGGEPLAAPARKVRDPQRQRREKLLKHLQANGVRGVFAENCALEFYHEGAQCPAVVRSIDGETQGAPLIANKPRGVLWLSPGMRGEHGKISTAWRHWATEEQYKAPTGSAVSRAHVAPGSLIIELTEENARDIDAVARGETVAPRGDEPRPLTPPWKNIVDWAALKDAGVDLVRVNGFTQREVFYGWDCDSAVVLNGESIVAWSVEEAETQQSTMEQAFAEAFDAPLSR